MPVSSCINSYSLEEITLYACYILKVWKARIKFRLINGDVTIIKLVQALQFNVRFYVTYFLKPFPFKMMIGVKSMLDNVS